MFTAVAFCSMLRLVLLVISALWETESYILGNVLYSLVALSDYLGVLYGWRSWEAAWKKHLKLCCAVSPLGIVKPFLWGAPQSCDFTNQCSITRVQLLKWELFLPIVDSVWINLYSDHKQCSGIFIVSYFCFFLTLGFIWKAKWVFCSVGLLQK